MNNFAALKQGQWVKIKGITENSDFIAYKIKIQPAGEHSIMESKLQEICAERHSVTLMNVYLVLDANVAIQNVDRRDIELGTLRMGEMIKLKGSYNEDDGFKPIKLKLQEHRGIDYDELQGFIDALDEDSRTLDVVGVRVALHANTEIGCI